MFVVKGNLDYVVIIITIMLCELSRAGTIKSAAGASFRAGALVFLSCNDHLVNSCEDNKH